MTVCVAAICERGMVVSVSDRMITAGDIEFEAPQRKVWHLTTSVCVMSAGDTTLQAEIMHIKWHSLPLYASSHNGNV